jgi:hypothetical protein
MYWKAVTQKTFYKQKVCTKPKSNLQEALIRWNSPFLFFNGKSGLSSFVLNWQFSIKILQATFYELHIDFRIKFTTCTFGVLNYLKKK